MTGILDVLLNLSFLPACGAIAEVRLEEIVAGHRLEAQIDAAFLAAANLVHGGAHIVVNTPPRNAAKGPEGVGVRVE